LQASIVTGSQSCRHSIGASADYSLLLRGHRPARAPDWFGPAIGADGVNRFDLPHRRTARELGICYLSPSLEGVILETVVRDARSRVLSVATLRRDHVVTAVRTTRDLLLIDLMVAPWTVHGVQADGIIYSSRFAPAFECLALWDRAVDALEWGSSEPLGADGRALAAVCNRLGIGLMK